MSWIPLESNPEVWTQFAQKIGLSSSFQFVDVWSLESSDIKALKAKGFIVVACLVLTIKANNLYKGQPVVIYAKKDGKLRKTKMDKLFANLQIDSTFFF